LAGRSLPPLQGIGRLSWQPSFGFTRSFGDRQARRLANAPFFGPFDAKILGICELAHIGAAKKYAKPPIGKLNAT
jgi:hypothetical protein